jgi:glucose/arabinose dehydrogenase
MHSSRITVILLSLVALWGLYGCSGKAGFEIALSSQTLELDLGSQTSIEITVNRKNISTDTPIHLSLENPPSGIKASDVILTGSKGLFTITSSKEGTYNLNLKASSDSFSTTIPLTVIVKAQGFTISATPKELSLKPFASATIDLQVNRLSIGENTVMVKLSGNPSFFRATPITITGNQGTLELQSTSAQEGTFDVTLEATSNGFTKVLPITVNITSLPSFILRHEPTNVNLKTGANATATLFIDRQNGFDQAVTVQTSNLPSGVSAPSVTIPSDKSQGLLVISAIADAFDGIYQLELTATSNDGTLSDSSTLSLELSKLITSGEIIKETVVSNLTVPWDLTFTPSGILYFTERRGEIKKVVDSNVITISHPLNVHTETEAGLMGMVFDPNYPQDPFVYTCYSYLEGTSIKNRVSRLNVEENSFANQTILIDAIPGSTNHDGCRILFGPDGKLYITMGDAKVGGNAQDTNSLSGKILRINKDGTIPSDNPFGNQVWSYGHRNAQGLAFDDIGRLYSSEHGDASEDEVNRIISGGNYGWPYIEGRCNTPSESNECSSRDLQEPLTVYTPTLAVSGIAFYNKNMFPEWQGNLLLASLKAGKLYRIIIDNEGRAVDEEMLVGFTTDESKPFYGRLRDVEVAPDGSIYLAISNRDGRGTDPFPLEEDDRIIRWYRE